MNEDIPLTICRNPAQSVSSVVKLFGFRVRGNSVYVFFGGLLAGVLSAVAAYQASIVLAGIMMLFPPLMSVAYIQKFIVNKPRNYVQFWVEERLHGAKLSKTRKFRGHKHAA